MKGVILAAGRGKRLSPLTSTRPKHLLPIIDKPLVRHVAEALAEAGVNEACIVIGYKSEMIKDTFKDFSKMKITFAVQKEQLGTADALLYAEEFIGKEEKFVLVYGDLTIEPEPLKELINIVGSVYDGGLIGIRHLDSKRFGIIVLKDGFLESIVEKPEIAPPTSLVNSGIYILPHEIFKASRKIEKSTRGEYELTDAITSLVKGGRRIIVYESEGEWWFDVGHPSDLLAANLRRLKLSKNFRKEVLTINDSYMDNDVYVSDNVCIESSVIMRNVKIERGASIQYSLILENAVINSHASLRYCIIGENAEIGEGSSLIGELSSPIVVGPGVKVPSSTRCISGALFQ